LLVIGVFSGKAGGINARLAIERLDFQPRIISQGYLPCNFRNSFCLFEGILKKRTPIFDDVGNIFIGIQRFQGDTESIKDCLDLSEFSFISGCKNDLNQICPPRICF